MGIAARVPAEVGWTVDPGPDVRDAARLKLEIGRAKLLAAIQDHGGTTIEAAHLLPSFAPMLPGIQAAGIRMLEISMGQIYMAKHPPSVRVHQAAGLRP